MPMLKMHMPAPPESVAAAKAAQRAERADVLRQTGIAIQDNGRIAKGLVLIHCVQCAHVSSARTDGRAVKALCSHIVKAHRPQES